MPLKKKPLEDAKKRLQEKLNNVEEQSEYICQFINDLVNKVMEIFQIKHCPATNQWSHAAYMYHEMFVEKHGVPLASFGPLLCEDLLA